MFFYFLFCVVASFANYDVAIKLLTKKLAIHVPRRNLEYLFCEHGPEGLPGIMGQKFSSNQIAAAIEKQKPYMEVIYECNPKIDVELAFLMIKERSKINFAYPQGYYGPMWADGYGLEMYVQQFYFENCIEPHIPPCNYTSKLIDHFAFALTKEKCPLDLEGWMGPVGPIRQHQVEFIGDKETFCKGVKLINNE